MPLSSDSLFASQLVEDNTPPEGSFASQLVSETDPEVNEFNTSLNAQPEPEESFASGLSWEMDRPRYFEQREKEALSDVAREFGGEFSTGRTTRTIMRGILNTGSELSNKIDEIMNENGIDMEINADEPYTDIDRVNADIADLELNEPELAASDEGKAYIRRMRKRSRDVIDANEFTVGETLKYIGKAAWEDPRELGAMFVEGMLEDPLLPVAVAAAYATAGRSMSAVGETSGLNAVITGLRTGNTMKKRALGIALKDARDVVGIVAAEASLGAIYEVAINKAIGRDPMHNVKTMAATNAALAGGFKGLGTAYRLTTGRVGRYASPAEYLEDAIKRNGEPATAEIITAVGDMMDKLPSAKDKDAVNDAKIAGIPDDSPFSGGTVNPRDVNLKPTVAKLKEYMGAAIPGLDKSWLKVKEVSGNLTEPVTSRGQALLYSTKALIDDYNNGLNWMQGLTRKVTKGTSKAAKERAEAFAGVDMKLYMAEMARRGGVNAHAEFMMKLELNRMLHKKSGTQGNQYSAALRSTFENYKIDPRRVTKNRKARAGYKIEAGIKRVGRTGAEIIASNGRMLYEPIKDIFIDGYQGGKQFVKDIAEAPVEGRYAYKRARNQIDNVLRDWEGGRMRGELPVTNFAKYVRSKLGSQDKLAAMAHYLENNIDGFNARRVRDGLDEVHLSPSELRTAPVIRKFFDDMHDWAQRASLFQDLRHNQKLYDKARVQAGMGKVKLDKEATGVWDFIQKMDDPSGAAKRLSTQKQLDSGMGYNIGRRSNYVPHATKHELFSEANAMQDSILFDAHRASRLQTQSRFTKQREYATIEDAKMGGETMLTEDISSLINMYGRSMVRAQLNRRLVGQLGLMKSVATGKPLIGPAVQMPEYYVKFKNENFMTPDGEYMKVHPNIAPDLRMYFETSHPGVINRALQNIVMIAKRTALSISMFHPVALLWSAAMTGMPIEQAIKNFIPMGKNLNSKGHVALAKGEGFEDVMLGLREGLNLGITDEMRGDTMINALRRMGQFAEEKTANMGYVKPLGKVVNTTLKGTALIQESLDSWLWDHVNTGMKATTYLTALDKIRRQDSQRVIDKGGELTDMSILRQRAAQFTNDAYGNQNWAQMAMNVENKMGHRIAAALNKPSMRGYIRMLIFAPDWTVSNLRVMGKSLDIKDQAHAEYLKYAIRSSVLYAMIAEGLQQVSGNGSVFDNEDAAAMLLPKIGDGNVMEFSKQFAEFLRLPIEGPQRFLTNKRSSLLKSFDHTDSFGDYAMGAASQFKPIAMGQAAQTGNWEGVFGVPVKKDYNRP